MSLPYIHPNQWFLWLQKVRFCRKLNALSSSAKTVDTTAATERLFSQRSMTSPEPNPAKRTKKAWEYPR